MCPPPHSHEYTLDAARLLGVGGYPRRGEYEPRVEDAAAKVCAGGGGAPPPSRGCDADALESMQRLADETEHAGAFRRIFPPSSDAELDALAPLAAVALASRRGMLQRAFAAEMYGGGRRAAGARSREMAGVEESASDAKGWDVAGEGAAWAEARRAVREENEKSAEYIRRARNEVGEADAEAEDDDEKGEENAAQAPGDIAHGGADGDGGSARKPRRRLNQSASRSVPRRRRAKGKERGRGRG